MADLLQTTWSETDSSNNAAAPDGFPEVRDSLAPLRELPSTIDQQDGRLAVLEARGHKAAGVAVALGALGTGAVGLLGWVGSKVAWNKLIGGS